MELKKQARGTNIVPWYYFDSCTSSQQKDFITKKVIDDFDQAFPPVFLGFLNAPLLFEGKAAIEFPKSTLVVLQNNDVNVLLRWKSDAFMAYLRNLVSLSEERARDLDDASSLPAL